MADIKQQQSRVLLVDDDPDLLQLLSVRLQANDFDVLATDSGETASGMVP